MASDSRHITPRPATKAADPGASSADLEQGSPLRIVDMGGFLDGDPARAAEEEAAARARPAADLFGGFTRWFDENNLLCGAYKEASPCSGRQEGARNHPSSLPSFGEPAAGSPQGPVRPRPPAFVNPSLQRCDAPWRTNVPPEAYRWPARSSSEREASAVGGSSSSAAIAARFHCAESESRVSEIVVASPSAPRTPNYVSLVTSFALHLPICT